MRFRLSVVIVVIFAAFATGTLAQPRAARKTLRLCQTRNCRRAASRVMNAMDTTADPCNDFYQFACGRWLKHNPISATKSSINQFTKANDRTQSTLKEILNSDDTGDRDAIKKAKKYYKACMNEDALEKKDARPAFDLIEEYGGFPLFGGGIEEKDFNLERYLVKTKTNIPLFLTKESSPLINVYVEVDFKNAIRHIIHVDQPQLGINSLIYLSDIYSAFQQAYRVYLHDFLKLIWESYDRVKGLSTFDEVALNDTIKQVYQMEAELAAVMASEQNRSDILGMTNKMTIKEMATRVSRDFDWFEYIKGVMAKADIEVDPTTEVLVLGTPYFSRMMTVLKKYSSRTIQNYVIIFDLVLQHRFFAKKYRDTLGPFRKVLTGSEKSPPRWKTCVAEVVTFVPRPVGAAYVQKVFSAKSRGVVLEMINYVIKSFRDDLLKTEWMDDKTKSAAELKVSSMGTIIGYPDYIVNASDPRLDLESEGLEISEEEFFEAKKNLRRFRMQDKLSRLNKPVDRDEWWFSPAMTNAMHFPFSNIIVFPAAILLVPFFGPGQSFALNYGAMGSIIAHEITHGFDTAGSTFDEMGNLYNWWSPASRKQFDQLTQCMRDQYSKFFHEEAGLFVNGNLTIAENIADGGGIKASFKGYQLWRKANPGREFQLPGLESFTPEQLFFIGNGQVWCAQDSTQLARLHIVTKNTSPGIFRLEGPLKNFPEFGKAFGCKKGVDKLYPDPRDTCTVW